MNGIRAFITVLNKLPLDFFMPAELEYINQFLCERFIDHHSFVPIVLLGIEHTVRIVLIYLTTFNEIQFMIFLIYIYMYVRRYK